jgi:hypothetical protein
MRTLVPALAVLVAAGSAHALEVTGAPGLTINGYGEAYSEVGERERNSMRNVSGRDEGYVEFPSDAALKLGYAHEDFTLRVDVIVASQAQYDNNNTLLEQCFVDWRYTPDLTLRAGRFQTTWLGWEGFHTPELWRVNHSAAWDWNVQNHGLGAPRPFVSDGVGAIYDVPDSGLTLQGFVVKTVLGRVATEQPDIVAFGGGAVYKAKGIGRFELGLAFDPNSTMDKEGTGSNAAAIDVNCDITALREQGWFFAAETQFHRHPRLWVDGERWGNDLVVLGMANYRFQPKMSVTVMLDYVERGFAAPDNEVMEYALALLTKPRNHVLLNTEVFYWQETAKHADQYGAAGVVLVMLP